MNRCEGQGDRRVDGSLKCRQRGEYVNRIGMTDGINGMPEGGSEQ